jgi:MoaA/NifB/PqqE/SkfB family radical SAM enzyme
MSEEDNPNLRVIEFKKPEVEAVPKFVINMLEEALKRAKEGKLETLIAHFNFSESEDGDAIRGGTIMWNKANNAIELLGLSEFVKSVALECVYNSVQGDTTEEGE